MRAAARLLPALFAAWISTPAVAQASAASAPVTVAVRIDRAAAGAYQLVPVAGVRAVTPLTGDAAAGDLPLTFFLPPALDAGRQRIASLMVGGETLAVWYDVPERRAIRIPAAPDLELLPGTTRRINVAVENLGNVEERAALELAGSGLAARAMSDSVTIPAGRSASFVVEVTVPRTARAGTSYQVAVVLTAGALCARGQQRITIPVHRRTAVPVEVGTAASLDGSPATTWVYAAFALSDSVRGGIATGRSAWPGLAGRRPPGISVTAPGWHLAAGELTLPRPTELVPWFAGTGGRVEVGRARGWSVGGSWLRDVLGGSAGLVSASLRRPGLHTTGALLFLHREGGSVLLPTFGANAWGRTARGDVSAGLLHSASGSAPIGSARGQLTAGAARIFASLSHTSDAVPDEAGMVLATFASAGVDVRLAKHSNLFLAAGGSVTQRDSAGQARALAGARTMRAGAQVRVGALSVAPAVEIRSLEFAGAGERSAAAATTALTWTALPSLRVRTDAGWEGVATPAGTAGNPRAGAEISWTGAPGFVSLLATYRAGTTWSAGIAPTVRTQLQAGFRGGWGSFDATAAVERQARGVVSYGSAAASLRVRSETDVLLGVRRVPRLGTQAPWEVTLGLRSTLAVPLPHGPDRRIVFEDENGNGRRDRGEPGIPGLQLRAPAWSGVTDHAGRYDVAPDVAEVIPDLSTLGPGWRIGSVDPRGIGLVRRGSIRATAYFVDPEPNALERVPRGSIVLVGMDGAAPIAAELDAGASARWSDLPAGRYRLYHVAPGAPSTGVPDNAAAVDVTPGTEAVVGVPASYRPRRVVVRRLDGDAPPSAPPAAAEPFHGDTTDVLSSALQQTAAATARCATPSPDGAVRPGMDEAALRCLLGDPDRVSRRGDWSYWFYARSPAAAGGVYDDIVFVRAGRVVTAILRDRGRRYEGPPPHQQLVEALRGSRRER